MPEDDRKGGERSSGADRGGRVEAPSGCAERNLEKIDPPDLPQAWRERYEERAAIREFDGGQPREHAEAEALKEILKRMTECS